LAWWKLADECSGCCLVELGKGVVEEENGRRAGYVAHVPMETEPESKRHAALSPLGEPGPCVEASGGDLELVPLGPHRGDLTFQILVPVLLERLAKRALEGSDVGENERSSLGCEDRERLCHERSRSVDEPFSCGHHSLPHGGKAFIPDIERHDCLVREAAAELAEEGVPLAQHSLELSSIPSEAGPGRKDCVVEQVTAPGGRAFYQV